MKKFKLKIAEKNGAIYSIGELQRFAGFTVKRFYFITNLPESIGGHAHFIQKELFVVVQGSCDAFLDEKDERHILVLERSEGVYVPPLVWHEFNNFNPDTILLALSSTVYNPDRKDYIENYEEYQRLVQKRRRQL